MAQSFAQRRKSARRRASLFLSASLLVGSCAAQNRPLIKKYSEERMAVECAKLIRSIKEFKRVCDEEGDDFYCKMYRIEMDVYSEGCSKQSRSSHKID